MPATKKPRTKKKPRSSKPKPKDLAATQREKLLTWFVILHANLHPTKPEIPENIYSILHMVFSGTISEMEACRLIIMFLSKHSGQIYEHLVKIIHSHDKKKNGKKEEV